ncbi:MAG: hypothetical protein WDO70_12045 [Alphaproteobacteria bacterium]
MKKILAVAALAAIFAMPAFAADPMAPSAPKAPSVKPVSAQAGKMKACVAEYHEKKIAKPEYRKFIGTCLKKNYKPGSYQSGMMAPAAAKMMPASPAPAMMEKPAVAPAPAMDAPAAPATNE